MRRCILYLMIIVVTGVACNEKPVIIPPFEAPDTDRVLLLEEITGVACPNCPDGQREVESIRLKYPENVISVVIYTDFLGEPLDNSKYDFRTEEGEQIEDMLGPYFGKPSLAVSRVKFENEPNVWMSFLDTWSGNVDELLQTFAKVYLDIDVQYDPASRDMVATVQIAPQENVSGDLRLSVMILENGIIDPQEDKTVIIDNYEHNHVLREMLTEFDGNRFTNQLTAGNIVERSFSFTLPPEDGWWVAENIDIVAFVTLVEGDSQEVLQATEVHLIK